MADKTIMISVGGMPWVRTPGGEHNHKITDADCAIAIEIQSDAIVHKTGTAPFSKAMPSYD
ncbi:MAG: hypothetical protein ACYSU7_17090 [Planctomycetota bacterium]